MKKIILLSFFIVSSTMMTSCTADPIDNPSITQADDTGGQNGQIPPPPPPPPKPPFVG